MKELKPGDRVRVNNPASGFHGKVGVLVPSTELDDGDRWPFWFRADDGPAMVGVRGDELEPEPQATTVVWVVTADYGLNGHEVLGVFSMRPDVDALVKARGCSSVTGYSGVQVNEMMVETR